MSISRKPIVPKKVKLETLKETVDIMTNILDEIEKGNLSNDEVLSLVKNILSVYSIILTDEEVEEILSSFE